MIQKNVLITGGSSGIGKHTVERFARAGYQVWFTYNSGEERARLITDSLADYAVTAFHYNQGDRESHKHLLAQLPGDVDILINNAGLGTKTVEAVCDDRLEQDITLMRVNALGPLWLTEALLPAMKRNGYGKILFLSSVGGGITQFEGFRLADEMSKAAVAHLGRQMAMELSNEPIDVFTVCPGATDTPMFRSSTLDHLDDAGRAALFSKLPGGRLINPEEIAELYFFLCQDTSRPLRGAVLDASFGLGVNPGALHN